MPFDCVNFIKAGPIRDPNVPGGAPMFRRRFTLTEPIEKAEVHVCGLGYGYYFLNGEPLTEDMFTAPVSDYRKTLWYNTYDVTDRLESRHRPVAGRFEVYSRTHRQPQDRARHGPPLEVYGEVSRDLQPAALRRAF